MEATTRTAGVEIIETAAREVTTTVTTTMEEATAATNKVPIARMDTARYVLSITDSEYWFSTGAFIQYVNLFYDPYRATTKDITKTTTRATITKATITKEATTTIVTVSTLDTDKATVIIKPLRTTSNRVTTSSISR